MSPADSALGIFRSPDPDLCVPGCRILHPGEPCYLFLPEITGHLSDKLKFSAGQYKNFPVLSDSPAVFKKTAVTDTYLKFKEAE